MRSAAPRATSLRLAQLIGLGPGWRIDELAHKFTAASIIGKKLKVLGGKQKLDLLEVRDAARLIAKLAVAPYSKWPTALNVSTGNPISVLELARLALKAAGTHADATEKVEIDENFVAPSFGMDNTKAIQLLEWVPLYMLEETLSCVAREVKKMESARRQGL